MGRAGRAPVGRFGYFRAALPFAERPKHAHMSRSKKRYLVTSALPYANGALHLGHLAGAYLPADIYVRYLRMKGEEVLFVCGSDEHGAAITMRAKKEGVSPRAIIDKYHELNKTTFERLGISFDIYHRTSSSLHRETAQQFFLNLYARGDQFEARTTEQYFDEEYQQFLADRYIVGTCPKCGYEEAYGDQCEKCGSALSPLELLEPRSVLSGRRPVLRKTTHWYFRLDRHEEWLREWIGKGTLDGKRHHDPAEWRKHVIGQCMSWLDQGLQPRAITRDLDWGVPVPLPEAKGKVLYVWFDAPIGYISATRQWAADRGEDWEAWWKGEDVQLVHFIGKDNIVFHCIVFPAMLKAHGGYALPVNVPANQFLNFEGQKFSKSRGWGIEQHEYLEAFQGFPNKEDALRWALARNLPENRDSDFKWDEFVEFHDKELADNLGNFVNRVLVLTHKYFGGRVPALSADLKETLRPVRALAQTWAAEIERFNLKNAALLFMEVSSWGNQFLQERAPWALYKENPDDPRVADAMGIALQVSALLRHMAEPFIPFSAARLGELLGMPPLQRGAWTVALDRLAAGQPLLAPGHRVGKPEILFAKIVDRRDDSRLKIVEKQKARLQALRAAEAREAEKRASAYPPVADQIAYEDFAKLDIRTGTILAAERVPKTDKLLKLTVDIGIEKRTVVSGIAHQYRPEDLIGQRVLLLANLAPRKLRGVLSQGMILMAEDRTGRLVFVQPADPEMDDGARIS